MKRNIINRGRAVCRLHMSNVKRSFELNRYEENGGLFMRMGIYRRGSVFKGVSTNANHAELKIRNIEISHQMSRAPSEKLTESELVIPTAEIE